MNSVFTPRSPSQLRTTREGRRTPGRRRLEARWPSRDQLHPGWSDPQCFGEGDRRQPDLRRRLCPLCPPQRQRHMRGAGRDVWVKIRASEAERAEWHAKARSAGVGAVGSGAPVGWPGAPLDRGARRGGARAHPADRAHRQQPEPARTLGQHLQGRSRGRRGRRLLFRWHGMMLMRLCSRRRRLGDMEGQSRRLSAGSRK